MEDRDLEDRQEEDVEATRTSSHHSGKDTLGGEEMETTHDLLDDLPSVSSEAGQPSLSVLGDYVLLRPIGAGGMGRVFEAKHRTMDRIVALKVLPSARMKDPEQVSRFRQEVKAAAKLFHPNIVTAFDAGESQDIHYLVMEYVDGSALSQTVKQHGPVTLETAISYVLQAAQGLQYAHSRGVVHRDIKPSNLMLDADGSVKILDMGTARFGEEEKQEENLTQTGVIMGTVNYMSPEQARDAHSVDHRTDIYSLGCTFYYLLTAKPLYEGDMITTLLAHAQKPIPEIQEYDRHIPDWVDAALKRMLAKNPNDRFQSITEVIESIESGLRSEQDDGDDESRELHGMLAASELLASISSSSEAAAQTVVGIDLGTAKSAVAYVNAVGKPVIVRDGEDQWQVPSAVLIDGISTLVGDAAISLTDQRPNDLALEIKRFVGKEFYPEVLQDNRYPPEVLLGLILSRLVDNVRRQVGPCDQVVIAVPAHFDEVARKAVQDAGYIAGVEVTDIINEPMAAALAHGYQQIHEDQAAQVTAMEGNVLIIDLGAGKLDVMALERQGPKWTAISSDGDLKLGGRDWDDCLEEIIAQAFQEQHGTDPRARSEDVIRLWKTAESVKFRLTQRDSVTVRFQGGSDIVEVKITREQFEKRAVSLLERVRKCIVSTLENAQWSGQDVDQIILVGAATQMPMIQKLVRGIISDKTAMAMLDPSSVALGAALHASYCRVADDDDAQPEQSYHNVSSHSLGIVGTDNKTGRKINAVVIPRNTRLPVTIQRTFKTHKAGQDSVMIQIVEGERSSPQQCQPIGQCIIENLPADLPALSPVTVEFNYSSNGRLNVFVESPDTGYRATKELTRSAGLANVDLHRWREWVETVMLCTNMV